MLNETYQLCAQTAEKRSQDFLPMSMRDSLLPYFIGVHGNLGFAIAAGYNFVYSCREHSQKCAQIGLFLELLEGQLSDTTYIEVGNIVKATAQVLNCLTSAGGIVTDGRVRYNPIFTLT